MAVEDDDFDFNERFGSLKAELKAQLKEEKRLNALIVKNLSRVKADNSKKKEVKDRNSYFTFAAESKRWKFIFYFYG